MSREWTGIARGEQGLHVKYRKTSSTFICCSRCCYDTRSIQISEENIESGTTDGTAYAVELLDVFLSEQPQTKVIPVLDDLTITEKIIDWRRFIHG